MDYLFLLQLILSFVLGGLSIAFLSFLAEKANKKIAGLILSTPTTLVLGFFFLGWTLSPEAVAQVVPSTLIPIGIAMLFTALYVHIALYLQRRIQSKALQIICSYCISISLWFLIAIPIVLFEINNLIIAISGYLFFIAVAHLLLARTHYEKIEMPIYSRVQKIIRAIFLGVMIFIIVLLGKVLGPFWGAVFTAFPAAFSPLLMILHWNYKVENLFPIVKKVPLGSLCLLAYVLSCMVLFPLIGFIWGTIVSYSISIIVTLVLIKIQNT